MNAQLKMLLWKEWRERRGQLWLCLAWIGAVPVMTFLWSIPVFSVWITLAIGYSLMMPIFIAMRTAFGETADGGQSFSAGLPIGFHRQASIRLVGGWAVLVLPILVGGALVALTALWTEWPGIASARHGWPGVWDNLWSLPGAVAAILWPITGLYLFLCLLATTRKTEFRFGLTAVVATILWMLMFWAGLPPFFLNHISPALTVCAGAIAPNTLNILARLLSIQMEAHASPIIVIVMPLAVNAILMSLAALLFVRRYGQPRLTASGTRWPRLGLGVPLRFPLSRTPDTALALLTLRQTVPLCLPGLAVICLVTGIAILTFVERAGHTRPEFGDIFPAVGGMVTILWAMIVGAGIFSEEIDARVGQSWRSWPISVGRFFVIKYVVGLLAVLAVLDGPAVLLAGHSTRWGNGEAIDWAYIDYLVPLHAMVYSTAVAASCILRRSTLGAMITLVFYLLVTTGLDSFGATARYEPFYVYSALSNRNPEVLSTTYPIVALAMALLALVASAAVAYRALARYDTPRGPALGSPCRFALAGLTGLYCPPRKLARRAHHPDAQARDARRDPTRVLRT